MPRGLKDEQWRLVAKHVQTIVLTPSRILKLRHYSQRCKTMSLCNINMSPPTSNLLLAPISLLNHPKSPKMSTGESQQERIANRSLDLGGESWYNGPEEIKDNWIILGELRDEDLEKEKSSNMSETVWPNPTKDKRGVQKDSKSHNTKAKKRAKYLDAKSHPEIATNVTDMAISWLKKAFGNTGFRSTVPDQGYHHPVRKNW
jgi:hypothetical protein